MTQTQKDDRKRVILADVSEDFRQELATTIGLEEDLMVVAQTGNGEELLNLVSSHKPDAVIMDLTLSGMDGLDVLEELRESRAKILVTSSFANASIAAQVSQHGGDYCMFKPCRVESVIKRTRELVREIAGSPEWVDRMMRHQITEIMHDLGIPAHLNGHLYIREAIILVIKDKNIINRAVTKSLYPAVAKIYGSTSARVERAIRTAIETAWDRGNLKTLDKYFGYTVSSHKGKPTNSEFIAMLADRISLNENME